MAQATHRLSGAHIEIASSVCGPEQLLDAVERTAEDVRGSGLHRGAKARVRVDAKRGHVWDCSLGHRRAMMTFQVECTAHAEETELLTRITGFRTRQSMFLGFIPAGPKELLGYHFYRTFMLDLREAVEALDPDAEIEIVERGA